MERSLRQLADARMPFTGHETSGVRHTPEAQRITTEDPITEAVFEHSDALREQVTEALLREAGFTEVIRLRGLEQGVHVDYPEEQKEEVYALYKDWLAPSMARFAKAIRDRQQVGSLRSEDLEVLKARIETEITDALHRPLGDIRQPSPSEDRWTSAETVPTSPYYLLGAQVEALRALLAHREDWLFRMDQLARGFMEERETGVAWEGVVKNPKWLIPLNRACGLADIAAQTLRPADLRRRHLALGKEAFLPEPSVPQAPSFQAANTLARERGERARADVRRHGDAQLEMVRDLVRLRALLEQHAHDPDDLPTSFDLPNIFQWRQAVQGIASRIVEIEPRRGSLEKMISSRITAADDSWQAMEEAHASLGNEGSMLVTRLRNLQAFYKQVGQLLDQLAVQGIVLDDSKPTNLRRLLGLVDARLEGFVVSPSTSKVVSQE